MTLLEELSGFEEITINKTEVEEAIKKIYGKYVDYPTEFEDFTGPDFQPDFKKLLNDKELFSSEADSDYGNMIFYAIDDDKRFALFSALKDEQWEDVSIINKLNTDKLKKWIYYYSIYHEERDYAEPNIYKLFDLARQGVKTIFSDATFSEKIFSALLKRYEFEDSKISRAELFKRYLGEEEKLLDPFKRANLSGKLEIEVYKSNIKVENPKIMHMWHKNQFTRKNVNPKVESFIKKIRRNYLNIGIISYMKIHQRNGISFEKLGDFAYFGGLRGLNTFKDKDVIFLIGTPYISPKDGLKNYNALFVKNEEETIKPKSKPSEFNLEYFLMEALENETYQSIHRARPFENPKTQIFVFGRLPDRIEEEFEVKKLTKKQTEEYFEGNFKGVYPSVLFNSISIYCLKNPDSNLLDIAKHFKLYKDNSKTSYNTPFITAIKNGEINLKDTNKINKAITEGHVTLKDIKKESGTLKIEDKFIENYIHYSKKGDFINLDNS